MCFLGMALDSAYHAPVLAAEVLSFLRGKQRVLDCTLGGGGHSLALLESGAGAVIGIDRDPDAIAETRARLARFEAEGRFTAIEANYADAAGIHPIEEMGFDGVLLDLGISSHQIDATERGFSFRPGAPLDMRMDRGSALAGTAVADAAVLLNTSDEVTLASIFRDYGDETRAMRLAREIVRRRATQSFTTSDDLVGAIRRALGPRTGPADFARLFQAVRIAVNDELLGLERALPVLRDLLTPGGVIVVIAYHSGEDRIVKHAFREWSADCICPPKQPVCTCRGRPLGDTLTRRAMTAGEDEISRNPRARSARLRAWQRVV
jgi:16S rRNA (cytosine1402-N4)-methyltransferase